MVVVDTSILIAWERDGGTIRIASHSAIDNPTVSAITISELLVGVYRARSEERRRRRGDYVAAVIERCPVLPFDDAIAGTHAKLFAELSKRGQLIGAHDMIIAATALHFECPVVTIDTADFARVPGLQLIDFSV